MNSPAEWDLLVEPDIEKKFKRFPKRDALVVWENMLQLAANPYFGDVKKMKGQTNSWRKRVGAYRVFYRIFSDTRVVAVYDVERRTSKTY